MNDWVEINIPYQRLPYHYIPKPNLDEQGRKIFGYTPLEKRKELGLDGATYCTFQDYEDKIATSLGIKYECPMGYAKFTPAEGEEQVHQEMRKLNIPYINKEFESLDFETKYMRWVSSQPEIIQWKLDVERSNLENKQSSFEGRQLDKIGTLIEIENDGQVDQILIGTFFKQAVYNDYIDDDIAKLINCNTIVKRYKVIWSPEC